MVERHLVPRLNSLLDRFPAVAILGPRQCGKTTLALIASGLRPAVYLDLELPSNLARLADLEGYCEAHEATTVVLDEFHRVPEIFAPLRGIIDRRKRRGIRGGQFLLLGSAGLTLLSQSSESLAGGLVYVELTPFHLLETPEHLDRLWVRGGYPESFLASSDEESMEWRNAFVTTYLERDIPALGPRIPAETLRRFWKMLAHNHGAILDCTRIAAALGVSAQTVSRYLDLLCDLFLARRLTPWASNGMKRLVRSPKVYLRDSGLVHSLLSLGDREAILGHDVAGVSWEGFVIENILAATRFRFTPFFYRTSNGAEIDLVLDTGKRRYAIEVKRSVMDPRPAKGFHIACADIEATHRYVVYPGVEKFQVAPGTIATPLLDLVREFDALP